MNAAIGWRPTDNFELNVDALYSKFTIDEDQNQAWYGRNFWGNWDDGQEWCYDGAQSSYTFQNGSIVGATLDNCYAPVTNVIAKYTEDKDLLVTGVNGKFETESWTVTGDLSFSNAERNNRWAAFMSEVWPATMTYDMSAGSTSVGHHELGSFRSDDPGGAELVARAERWPRRSHGRTFRRALRRGRAASKAACKSLQLGVRFSEREKDYCAPRA